MSAKYCFMISNHEFVKFFVRFFLFSFMKFFLNLSLSLSFLLSLFSVYLWEKEHTKITGERRAERERREIFGCARSLQEAGSDFSARSTRSRELKSRRFQLLLSALTQHGPLLLIRKRRACGESWSPLRGFFCFFFLFSFSSSIFSSCPFLPFFFSAAPFSLPYISSSLTSVNHRKIRMNFRKTELSLTRKLELSKVFRTFFSRNSSLLDVLESTCADENTCEQTHVSHG